MIKTHKPRGYSWTHASAFQQTKDFRKISYEECAAPTSGTLTPNADAALPDGDRRRKRRRIERLADDFLNGQPLFISSARPCPEALKSTIIWNQKSSTDPKFEFSQSTVPYKSTCLWQDVDDDDAHLDGHCAGLREIQAQMQANNITHTADLVNGVPDQPVPQAIPRPSRRVKSANISTGPSSDALRKAAALRARKAHQPGKETKEPPEPELAPSRRLPSNNREAELKQSNDWLFRKETTIVSAKSKYEEDSLDELRLSRFETLANPHGRTRSSASFQPLAQLTVPNQSGSDEDQRSDSPFTTITPRISETTNLLLDMSHNAGDAVGNQANDACLESNSYHTAHEETDIHSNDDQEEGNGVASNDDSQIRLLKSQGFEGAIPTSWRAVNQQQPQRHTTSMLAIIDSRQRESAGGTSSTHPEPSSTSARPRRSASQDGPAPAQPVTEFRSLTRCRKRTIYRTEPNPANGSSPFKWRRKVTFPSSDEIIIEPRQKQTKTLNIKNVSQSAPVTPAARTPQPSSNLLAPLAQIDAAQSSPVLTSHSPSTAAGATMLQQSLPETWAGTQAMLLKAQRDLLTSPGKLEETPAAAEKQDHTVEDDESLNKRSSQRVGREPLQQLSQEPMPSTQALIGDFVGFSTVKKPRRGGLRESIDSPSVLLRGKEARLKSVDNTSPVMPEHHDRSSQSRPSGLRFSTESAASPLRSTNIDEALSPIIRRGTDWSSTDVATSSKKSGSRNAATKSSPIQQPAPTAPAEAEHEEVSQSLSFSTRAGLPSFQAAQAWSPLQLSNEDDSNIDRTIEELTTYLLDTTDMQGI